MGINPIVEADFDKCMAKVREIEEDYDVVLFAGSLYLIGMIRGLFK